jgi:WD40 repeat protein
MQEFSDDHPITCAKFSGVRFEIYVAAERSVKVWDARSGRPIRALRNITDSDITCLQLDTEHRKLIVGSHTGEVKLFDIVSGVNTLTLDQHNPFEGEISFLGYAGEDHTVISCGWDRVIKVHMDETKDHSIEGGAKVNYMATKTKGKKSKPDRVDKFYNLENLLRGRMECHNKDINCGDFAMHLDLIATGGRDNRAKVWDYERITCLEEIQGDESGGINEITMVRFIAPFPLLLTSDSAGQVYIWLT